MFPTNKFKKILILSVSVLMLLGGVFFFLLSLDSVQTKFAQRITQNVNDNFETNISVEKASIKLNGDVFVRKILVQDHHRDTLLFVDELKTSLNGLDRFLNGNYDFNSIRLDGVQLFLTQYEGENKSSLQKFISKLRDSTKTNRKPFNFKSNTLEINSSVVVVEDLNSKNSKNIFSDIDLKTSDFNFESRVLEVTIESFTGSSRKFGKIDSFKSKLLYSSDSLIANDFNLHLNKNILQGSGAVAFLGGSLANLKPAFFNINIYNSKIHLNEIKSIENYFRKDAYINSNLKVKGTLDNLLVDFNLQNKNEISITASLRVLNGFDRKQLAFNSDNFKIKTSDLGIKNLLSPTEYSKLNRYLAKMKFLNIDSNLSGSSEKITLNSVLDTSIGKFRPSINLINKSELNEWEYIGSIEIEELNLSTLLDRSSVIKSDATLSFEGEIVNGKNKFLNSSGLISKLQVNSNLLQNIRFNISQSGDKTKGSIVSNEIMHDFDLKLFHDAEDKSLEVIGDLNEINLSKLNFAERLNDVKLSSKIKILTQNESNFTSTFGIVLEVPTITNKSGKVEFQDFKLKANSKGLSKSIKIQDSDAINVSLDGDFEYKNFSKHISRLFDNLFFLRNYNSVYPKESFDFDIHLKSKLTEALFPSLSTPDDFFLSGFISSDVKESAVAFDIPILLYKDYEFKGLNYEYDSSNTIYTSFLSADEIRVNSLVANEIFMISTPFNNESKVRIEGVLNNKKSNSFEANLSYTLKDKKTIVDLSKFKINNQKVSWELNSENSGKFIFNSLTNSFNLEQVLINNADQNVSLSGNYKSKNDFDFQIKTNNVLLQDVLPEIENFELKAKLDSEISFYKTPLRNDSEVKMKFSNLNVNDIELGDLLVNSEGNTGLSSYRANASLQKGAEEQMNLSGGILVHDKRTTLDLDLKLNKMDMSFLSKLGKGKITEITSLLTGSFNLWGPLNNLSHSGNLTLDNFNMTVPYTNASYGLSESTKLTLFDQVIKFETSNFFDQHQNTSGVLKGEISHLNFKDWEINFDILTNRLLLMDRPEVENTLFYGSGYLNGGIHIHGPTKNLIIDVDGATAAGTSIVIPWEENTSLADISFIDFIPKSDLNKINIDEEQVSKGITISRGLEMTFDLDVNNNAKVEIVVDQISGSTLTGRGSGNILMETNIDGKFNMWGDFIAYDGIYNFKNFGLIDKKFNVKQGGTIVWEGDPLDAQMNLEAIYEVPGGANPALLVDNPNFNKKIPTNVLIKLEGNLLKPDNPKFEINFPNTSGIVASEINYRLADQQRRQLQAISLLSQGIFVSDVSFSTQGIANNLYEKASDVLSSFLGESDGKLDFGLNYLKGDSRPDLDIRSQDRIGITFVTQISDKVLLNGKIGVPVGGVEETLIVGDVQIDFILNEEGTLKAKVFNRENEFRYISDDLGYTQGIGLSYQVDFETFEGLIQKIISAKK